MKTSALRKQNKLRNLNGYSQVGLRKETGHILLEVKLLNTILTLFLQSTYSSSQQNSLDSIENTANGNDKQYFCGGDVFFFILSMFLR
jgi:hypothetical protein